MASKDPMMCVTIPIVFYPNECFICKTPNSLKRCSRCNMISYCGKDHQLQHWPVHKEICKAISAILKEKKISHIYENCRGFDSEKWRVAKEEAIQEVERGLKRSLNRYEQCIFSYPRACFVCHDSRQEMLNNCPGCRNANFCNEHPSSPIHDIDCPIMQKCYQLDFLYSCEKKMHLPNLLLLATDVVEKLPIYKSKSQELPTSLEEFMQYAHIPKDLSVVQKLYISEFLILPLTTFGALQKLKLLSVSKLLIHTNNMKEDYEDGKSWEILFHLIPNLTQLRIVMIGEGEVEKYRCKLCDKCRANKKKLFLKTVKNTYIDYTQTNDFEEPGLVLLSNQDPPFADDEVYQKMWKLMLMTWGIVNCPLVLLTFTEEKAKTARESIESTFNNVLISYDGKNNFANGKPNRLWENERIFRDNDQMIIYKILHPKEPLKCDRCGLTARTVDSKTSKCAGCEADLISSDITLFPKQNDNRFRNFYYENCCQVCHLRPDPRENRLISCKHCKLISYCNKDHQKDHWPQHRDLCKVIFDMISESGSKNLVEHAKKNANSWLSAKINLMLEAQEKLGRNLVDYEKDIFFFPTACFMCHESNSKFLKTCIECGMKLCKDDQDCLEHREICQYLTLTFQCDVQLLPVRQSPAPITTMEAILLTTRRKIFKAIPLKTKVENLPKKIAEFVEDYIDLSDQTSWAISNPQNLPQLRQILCIDIFSRPLTLLHIMEKHEWSFDSMIVHVIGATDDEKSESGYWEIFLHFVPNLKNLEIVFIGPEVSELKSVKVDVCEGCLEREKSLEVKGFSLKYDEYFQSESFVKPDIIVGYNLHMYESNFGLIEDTWKDTILTLTKINAPFLTTAETVDKVKMDGLKLEECLGVTADSNYPVLNPFKGFSLQRDFLTEKYGSSNQYMALYTGLFGLEVSKIVENSNSTLETIIENPELESVKNTENFELQQKSKDTNLEMEETDFGIGSLKIGIEK